MCFFVFPLRAVRPAVGNHTARNWQPSGPQLENKVLAGTEWDSLQCVVTFIMRHIGIWPLFLGELRCLFLYCQKGYKKAPFTRCPL